MKLKSTITAASLSLLALSSAQAAQMKQAFSYDAAGRLTGVTSDGGSAKVSLDEHYAYDASGNITEKVVAGQTVRMTYDAGNQLMSRTDAAGTVDFVYDSAGRLASERQNGESIAQYQYGYLDKVTQVTRGDQVTQFHYNANGMLVAKERDGQIVETFGWDGIGLIAKDDTVYANEAHVSGGVPLAAINAGSENSELQYFDSDYLGTTTAVYSATGEVDAKLAGSFGAGTESDEVRFTGKPYDADLDAHVFPFRNYKSEAGRWASADPAGFPDGPNQHYYACVPTMSLDPLWLVSRVSGASASDFGNIFDADFVNTFGYSVEGSAHSLAPQGGSSVGSVDVEFNAGALAQDWINLGIYSSNWVPTDSTYGLTDMIGVRIYESNNQLHASYIGDGQNTLFTNNNLRLETRVSYSFQGTDHVTVDFWWAAANTSSGASISWSGSGFSIGGSVGANAGFASGVQSVSYEQ